MSDLFTGLQAQNPLMLLIEWDEKSFFTSHYFHQQYLANKPDGGKYARQGDFMRLIRSIETYPNYLESGDIVELEWKSLKDKSNADFALLKDAFKANGYRPIMLISATAQLALAHHLDDEISKEVSVKVNEQAAGEAVKPKRITAKDVASILFMCKNELLQLPGVKPELAMACTFDAIEVATGLPARMLSKALPSTPLEEAAHLNATQIGEKVGMKARAVNSTLKDMGLIYQDDGKEWRLTDTGQRHGELKPFHRNGHSGYEIAWKESVVPELQTYLDQGDAQ
jgi:hypothetical protein